MPSPINVGIAGLGRSGWNIHADVISSLPDRYKIIAVADADPTRRKEAQEKFDCIAYPDFESLNKNTDVQLLVVATPNHMHAEHATAALYSGHDVVCEKPMGLTSKEADQIIHASQQTKQTLAPFQNLRYEPSFVKVQEVIKGGVLGRIVQIRMMSHQFARRWDWQTLKEFGGGSLNNTGPHLIDQALQLFGSSEPKLFCHMDRALTSGDAEDHVKVILQGPDAPLVEVEVTSACAFNDYAWLVMGTSGSLRGNSEQLDWQYVDFSALPAPAVDPHPTPGRSYNSEQLPWQNDRWQLPAETRGQFTRVRFYEDLYKTLSQGQPLVITPSSVRRQIDIIERCHAMSGI